MSAAEAVLLARVRAAEEEARASRLALARAPWAERDAAIDRVHASLVRAAEAREAAGLRA